MSKLPPSGHPAITHTPIIRTVAQSPAKKKKLQTFDCTKTNAITDSRKLGHLFEVPWKRWPMIVQNTQKDIPLNWRPRDRLKWIKFTLESIRDRGESLVLGSSKSIIICEVLGCSIFLRICYAFQIYLAFEVFVSHRLQHFTKFVQKCIYSPVHMFRTERWNRE